MTAEPPEGFGEMKSSAAVEAFGKEFEARSLDSLDSFVRCPVCSRTLRPLGSKIPRHGDRIILAVPQHAVGGYRTKPCVGSGMAANVPHQARRNSGVAPDAIIGQSGGGS